MRDVATSRAPRAPAELVAASEELLYEIEQFFKCWFLLSKRWSQLESLGKVFEEGIAVAFLVHGRSLIFAFYAHHPQPEDVVASDFFPTPGDWDPSGLASAEELQSIRRWVGRDVAHTSYRRLVRGADRRNYHLIATVVRRATLAFLEAVPPGVVTPDFPVAVTAAAKLGTDDT